MNKIRNSPILNGSISAIFAAIIQLIIVSISIPYGTIIVNEPINIKNNTYLYVVDIINDSDNIVKNIGIELPGKLLEINSSLPLDYKVENYKNGAINKILVNTIHEKSNYQIIAKYKKNVESAIVISNYKTNNLSLTNKKDYLSFERNLYIYIIATSLFYGLFSALSAYYTKNLMEKTNSDFQKKRNVLLQKVEETKNRLSSNEKTAIKLNEKVFNLERRSLKLKLLYTARISDYKKELSFWRDTIRKVINNETTSEKVIDEITTNLKTYKTLETLENDELKYLEIAELIVENKNKKAD